MGRIKEGLCWAGAVAALAGAAYLIKTETFGDYQRLHDVVVADVANNRVSGPEYYDARKELLVSGSETAGLLFVGLGMTALTLHARDRRINPASTYSR